MENKNRNTAAIGVFDSGVGGLTVTREIMRQLPNENVVYFGIQQEFHTEVSRRITLSVFPDRSSVF